MTPSDCHCSRGGNAATCECRDGGAPAAPLSPHFDLPTFLRRIRETRYGFLDSVELAMLARADRLRLVLIRWHEGRALVAAQDAAGLIRAAEVGGWTVRDVSFPAESPR